MSRSSNTPATPVSNPASAQGVEVTHEMIEQARSETAWALNRWKQTMFTPELVEAIFTAPALSKILALAKPAAVPASGGVGQLEDKIEGLEADLESAVEAAYRRGAVEWTRLNYPKLYVRFNAAALSASAPAPEEQ